MLFVFGLVTGLAGGVLLTAVRLKRLSRAPVTVSKSPFEKRLDDLQRTLSRHKDVRDEALLRDLRSLLDQTTTSEFWPPGMPAGTAADIHADVARLFDASVALLRRQYEILQEARPLKLPGRTDDPSPAAGVAAHRGPNQCRLPRRRRRMARTILPRGRGPHAPDPFRPRPKPANRRPR